MNQLSCYKNIVQATWEEEKYRYYVFGVKSWYEVAFCKNGEFDYLLEN